MRIFVWTLFILPLVLFGCGGKNDDSMTSGGAQPQISGVIPPQASPGTISISGRITGSNLHAIRSVDMGPGIVVENFTSISDAEIYIIFSVTRDAAPGVRTVTVNTATGTGTSTSAFSVGNNRLPEANFVVRGQLFADRDLEFDASNSHDSDGGIVNYQWDFGDRKRANGRRVTHKFSNQGLFLVSLTVTDSGSGKAQFTRSVDVAASRPPKAEFGFDPASGDTDTSFHFDGNRSHDPDGKIGRFAWGFGDGATAIGAAVNHQFTRSGTISVTLTVTDDSGSFAFITKFVAVREVDHGGGGGDGGGGDGGTVVCKGGCVGFSHIQPFVITDVNGDTITIDHEICACKTGVGEVRRPNTNGIAEFLGDAVSVSARTIVLNHQGITSGYRAPRVGENAYLVYLANP